MQDVLLLRKRLMAGFSIKVKISKVDLFLTINNKEVLIQREKSSFNAFI